MGAFSNAECREHYMMSLEYMFPLNNYFNRIN